MSSSCGTAQLLCVERLSDMDMAYTQKTRRSSRRPRRRRNLERAHRRSQPPRREPDLPSPLHRHRHESSRHGRPLAGDHRRRPGRDLGAEGHGEWDGHQAEDARGGGDEGDAGGGVAWTVGRTGECAGCGRGVAGSDIECQFFVRFVLCSGNLCGCSRGVFFLLWLRTDR